MSFVFIIHIIIFLILILLSYLYKSNKNIKKEKVINCKDISVLIPFRDEEKNISSLISSIKNLKKKPKHFYFINDHSKDNSLKIIKDYDISNCTILNLTDKIGKKNALKLGFFNTNTNYILTVDSDSIFQNNFFENIEKVKDADLIILPVKVNSSNILSYFFDIDYYYLNSISYLLSKFNIFIQASGANLLIKNELYKNYIENDNYIKYLSGDDYFLLKYAKENNYNIINITGSKYYNTVKNPTYISEILKQRIRWINKVLKTVNFYFIIIVIFILYMFSLWIISIFYGNIILSVLLKIIFDFSILFFYLLKIKDLKKLIILPFFSILQLPYYILIIILTLFWKVEWKGRKIT